ncbi:unnamed protein product [Linum tenue]|uniref:GATA-type domain-containing protein n=1 Tax=Linum tenue TaxID=586396 RepID=A0AAV0S5S0_9ROSI|nr:unnamed protein product [Linum tenue]
MIMSTTTTQPNSSNYHQFPQYFSIDLNQDHHHHQQQQQYLQQAAHFFSSNSTTEPAAAALVPSSSSSPPPSLPYHIFIDVEDPACRHVAADYSSWGPPPTFHQQQQKANDTYGEVAATEDRTKWVPCSAATTTTTTTKVVRMSKKNNKLTIKTNTTAAAAYSDHGRTKKYSASAWDPQKMSHDTSPSTLQQQQTDERNNSPLSSSGGGGGGGGSPTVVVRVCADCNTTKTPLWRSGPRGPKSLCNACGIRQRKARRAMAAAAAAAAVAAEGGADLDTTAPLPPPPPATTIKLKTGKGKHANKNKLAPSANSHLPFKKRCKFAAPRGRKATIGSNSSSSSKNKVTTTTTDNNNSDNKLCFEDLVAILSKSCSAIQRVFPQDEKEAAILLMALSYGLVQS